MPIYETLKALHIIFVVTWFAGLFYIVRLFIYAKEAQDIEDSKVKDALTNQYAIMKKRLWYGITWPSAILTLIFGLSLISYYLPNIPIWLHIKLALLVLLYAYHFYCGHIYKSQAKDNYSFSAYGLRIFNELATLFLFTKYLFQEDR